MTIERVVNILYPTQQIMLQADQTNATSLRHEITDLTAATNNQIVVGGITDYIIKVYEINLHSVGAAGQVIIHDNSGTPNNFYSFYVPANTVAAPNVYVQAYPYGLIDVVAGKHLQMDNLGAAIIWATVRYIQWRPRDS